MSAFRSRPLFHRQLRRPNPDHRRIGLRTRRAAVPSFVPLPVLRRAEITARPHKRQNKLRRQTTSGSTVNTKASGSSSTSVPASVRKANSAANAKNGNSAPASADTDSSEGQSADSLKSDGSTAGVALPPANSQAGASGATASPASSTQADTTANSSTPPEGVIDILATVSNHQIQHVRNRNNRRLKIRPPTQTPALRPAWRMSCPNPFNRRSGPNNSQTDSLRRMAQAAPATRPGHRPRGPLKRTDSRRPPR